MTQTSFHTASVNDASQHVPQRTAADGTRTWITRATNFVLATSMCHAGSVLDGDDLPDESMLLLPEVGATIEIGDERIEAKADSLLILPPGRARITSHGAGTIVHCCSHRATGLLADAGNAADFADPRPEVAALAPWPAPVDGFRVRLYHLPSLTAAGDKMRIFRSTNLMVNIVAQTFEPRDVRALSPHSHTDFEQATLCVRGRYVHHLRTPWTPDQHQWREDQHVEVGSPSVTVIPVGVIHTSRNTNAGGAMLIDVFAPPRLDFALHPSWGRNNDDYPLPPQA